MIQDLLEATDTARFEDFGSMNLESAKWLKGNLDLELAIYYDDTDDGSRELWALSCKTVYDYMLARAVRCGINYWRDEHPALAQFAEPLEHLYFGAPTDHPDRVLGKLLRVHRKVSDDWIPFDKYLNTLIDMSDLIRSDYGQLAYGPLTLIDSYFDVLQEEGMRPRRVGSPAKPIAPKAEMIHFGDSYVIARSFEAKRVE